MNDRPTSDPRSPWPAPRPQQPSTEPTSADERLARLAARRAAAPSSSAAASRPAAGRPATAANDRPTRRTHAAGRARAGALALSVTTTVGLAAYLQHANAASADTAAGTAAPISGGATATTAATAATTDATTATTPATTADSTASTAAATTAAADPATTVAADPATTVTTVATPVAATSSSGLADGTFVGDTFTNKWGPVEVQITVSGGQIVTVDVLQYPTDDRKSVTINQRALPTLIQSTLTAQSSDVDTVSGATYTSDSYRQSLQTAIDDARAAATAVAA